MAPPLPSIPGHLPAALQPSGGAKNPQVPSGAIRVFQGQQVTAIWRSLQSFSGSWRAIFTILTDDGRTVYYVGPDFGVTTADYTIQTQSGALPPVMPEDGWCVGIEITGVSGSLENPTGQCWLAWVFNRTTASGSVDAIPSMSVARFFRGGNSSAVPCWEWRAGMENEAPFYHPSTPSKLFNFQGVVTNGAGGAGDNTLTITAPTHGRVRLLYGQIRNQDTAARAASMIITDGTNNLHLLGFNSALGAGNNINYPSLATTDAASFAANGASGPYWIAGAMTIVFTNAAVAASQDTAFACVLEVYGGAPTCTIAGASTPTLTVNTNAFVTG